MKRIARLAVAALLSVALTVSFTGCSSDEIALFEASLKLQTAKSMEINTDLNFSIEVTGLSEESLQLMQSFLPSLNDMNVSINQKINQNDDRTAAQAQMEISVDAGGLKLDTGMWIDSDFSGETPVMKEIIKLPSIIGMLVPPESGIKEYIVLDLGETMNTSGSGVIDYGSMLEQQVKLQTQMAEFMRTYIRQFNPGFAVATRKESRTVLGETVTVYEVRLDDASFKAFIRYAVNNFLQNEDALNFLKEITVSAYISEAAASQAGGTVPSAEASAEAFVNFVPLLLEQANKVLDALEDVKILGDKGMLIEYFVNSVGYVVGSSGTADIIIDIAALTEAFSGLIPPKEGTPAASPLTPEGIWRIGVNYNTEVYNINKDVEIEFPELTSENSVNYTDLMKSITSPPAPSDGSESVRVVVNGRLLTFDVPPMVSEGRILVPVRGVFEALGAEVSWDGNTQTVTGVKGNKTVMLKLNSRDALVNGSPCTLDVPATAVGGRVLVPVRFVSESLGAKVEWDQATRTAIITGQEVIDMLDSVETVDI